MFDRVLSCLLNPHGPLPQIPFAPTSRQRGFSDPYQIPLHDPVPESLNLEPEGASFALRGKTVQVITKIAEIHLTPENPIYPGGTWHVEGFDAEQIVATGIYYFVYDNITESRLSFRVIVQTPEYHQDDYVGMRAIYGLVNAERLVQSLGSVVAIENRCVVFPNSLQHHVEPFELADKTRSGVRKILAFFIVDLSKRIPSTADIPPQQQADWVHEELDGSCAFQHSKKLPDEIVGKDIQESLGAVGMTLGEAKQYRQELMVERHSVASKNDESYEVFYSLCEH